MKKLLLLVGMTICGVASLSAQNTPGTDRAQTPRSATGKAKSAQQLVAQAKQRSHAVYYVTSINMTGSHIPLVVCRYQGSDYAVGASSPGNGYGSNAIAGSGATNVGASLRSLDPAITIR